ncbi:MAG TPA: sigma factor-like helix-turn-helix DNA-binding protein [Micromonosporaceae bacterium]
MGPGKPGPPNREEAIQRRADVWQAKVHEGLTQAELAKRFGCSQQRISQLLSEAAAEISQATSEEARKELLDKLARLQQRVQQLLHQAEQRDDASTALGAVDRLLKVASQIADLTGARAPTQVESRQYSYSVNGVDPEVLK